MKVVLELDLWDDPEAVRVNVRCGSVEDFQRLQHAHPAGDGEGLDQRVREDGSTASWYTATVWTEQGNKVHLTAFPPATSRDYA